MILGKWTAKALPEGYREPLEKRNLFFFRGRSPGYVMGKNWIDWK